MSRLLAIDYGEKNLGIAVSDPSRVIASSLHVWKNKDAQSSCAHLQELCTQYEVGAGLSSWGGLYI